VIEEEEEDDDDEEEDDDPDSGTFFLHCSRSIPGNREFQ
jgi:hypothetical protein